MQKNIIVLNDLRSIPMMAALSLSKRTDAVAYELLISERFILNFEYGDNNPPWFKKIKIFLLKRFANVRVVPKIIIDNIDESMEKGIDSSMQSITIDSEASRTKYPLLYAQLLQRAFGAVEISKYIQSVVEKDDCVYIFNGRTASSSSIVNDLHYSEKKINIKYYEYSSNGWGYTIFPVPCHDTRRVGAYLYKFWTICAWTHSDLYLMGNMFEKNKLTNEYTRNYQHVGYIDKYDVVVFLGSDHEYTNLQLDIIGISYIGNIGLIKYAISKYGLSSRIAVRMHPNMRNDKSMTKSIDEIVNICSENGIVCYRPESNVSSYELIKNAKVTVVEYSSIAVDAILLCANVDIVGDLDVKKVIQQLPSYVVSKPDILKQYIRQIMSLQKYLFHYDFEKNVYYYLSIIIYKIENKYYNYITQNHII